MKGKILEYGVILGDDGLKYSFSYDDIMNLSKKGQHKLENFGVDFIPDNDTATEIYLLIKENSATQTDLARENSATQSDTLQTKITRRKPKAENFENQNAQNDSENKENYYNSKSWQKGENSQDFENLNSNTNSQKTQIDSIKRKAYIMMVSYTLFFLVVPLIVAVVFHIKLVLELQRVSHSKTLLRNLILSIAAPLVACAVVFVLYILLGITFREVMNFNEMTDMDRFYTRRFLDDMSIIVFVLIACVLAFYFDYLYSKELAYITNQPYFMRSFWLSLVASIFSGISEFTAIFGILSIAFYIACFHFYIQAWGQFKEVIVKER